MVDDGDIKNQHVLVVGAGQAGFSVCAKLRTLGLTGPITLLGEEGLLPYQRPPLSKAYLLKKMTQERLYFRPESFYKEQDINLVSGRVEHLDPEQQAVTLNDDSVFHYDKLVLATGARPIELPSDIGGNLLGVHYIRTLADADKMAGGISPGMTMLVVGGGYIGLEAAAVASELGLDVTLVEAAPRILQRVAAPETAQYFRDLHVSHGVHMHEGIHLERLVENNGRVKQAILSDGKKLDVDIVAVGIGIRPNQELAQSAGLAIDNGIKVDKFCRTSDPHIYAAGDCASFPYHDHRIRLESVGNAIDQAEAAACNIMGEPIPYVAKPWFWSDQYTVKLQIAGLSRGYDTIITRQNNENSVSYWYFAENKLLAVDAVNAPRDYMIAKRLIESGRSPVLPPALVATHENLKTLLA